MYRIEKSFRFEASHILPHHDGKCSRLHGHSWVGKVIIEREDLEEKGPQQGMVMDFGEISRALAFFVEKYLDHHHLNDTLKLESPTSEMIAAWLHFHLQPHLPGLICVRIEETCTSAAEYWGGIWKPIG